MNAGIGSLKPVSWLYRRDFAGEMKPFGQRPLLDVDADGYLESIESPGGKA